MLVPVILCGGSGTRLWPLSRSEFPKQYLPLVNTHTLFQNTLLRLQGLPHVAPPVVVCNESHRFIVAEQLLDAHITPSAILLEPAGRNTAPAIAVAALHATQDQEDPVLLVLPADHHFENISALHQTLSRSFDLARSGNLVTFGIVPDFPATGYGYIKKSTASSEKIGFKIDQFVEKPDLKTAEHYVASKQYLWNSGMFMFTAGAYLEELGRFNPEILRQSRCAFDQKIQDLDFIRLDEQSFRQCPADSIDYAVMEKTTHGAVVPLDAGWSDVGSWDAIWDIQPKNADGNVIKGDVISYDTQNSYLYAADKLLAVVGCREHIIIQTADAVMIAPKARVQEVKNIVKQLKRARRPEARRHPKIYKPWGSSQVMDQSDRFHVRKVIVKPGAKLSIQKHYHRSEHWVVLNGTARVHKEHEAILLSENQSTYIPLGTVHQLENPGKIPLELIEIQTGGYLEDDDVERFEKIE